jgi:hypothetical protein
MVTTVEGQSCRRRPEWRRLLRRRCVIIERRGPACLPGRWLPAGSRAAQGAAGPAYRTRLSLGSAGGYVFDYAAPIDPSPRGPESLPSNAPAAGFFWSHEAGSAPNARAHPISQTPRPLPRRTPRVADVIPGGLDPALGTLDVEIRNSSMWPLKESTMPLTSKALVCSRRHSCRRCRRCSPKSRSRGCPRCRTGAGCRTRRATVVIVEDCMETSMPARKADLRAAAVTAESDVSSRRGG